MESDIEREGRRRYGKELGEKKLFSKRLTTLVKLVKN